METQELAFENWIEVYLKPRYPELIPYVINEHSAFQKIIESGRIDSEELQVIIDAVYSSRTPLAHLASADLAILTEWYEEVQNIILQLSLDKRWYVRYNSILCIESNTPHSLAIAILEKLIKDKSFKVRVIAADKAFELNLIEMLPIIQEQQKLEKNDKAKKEMEFIANLMGQGYYLEKESQEVYSVTIKKQDRLLVDLYSKIEIETRGIDSIIKEMLQESE